MKIIVSCSFTLCTNLVVIWHHTQYNDIIHSIMTVYTQSFYKSLNIFGIWGSRISSRIFCLFKSANNVENVFKKSSFSISTLTVTSPRQQWQNLSAVGKVGWSPGCILAGCSRVGSLPGCWHTGLVRTPPAGRRRHLLRQVSLEEAELAWREQWCPSPWRRTRGFPPTGSG